MSLLKALFFRQDTVSRLLLRCLETPLGASAFEPDVLNVLPITGLVVATTPPTMYSQSYTSQRYKTAPACPHKLTVTLTAENCVLPIGLCQFSIFRLSFRMVMPYVWILLLMAPLLLLLPNCCNAPSHCREGCTLSALRYLA